METVSFPSQHVKFESFIGILYTTLYYSIGKNG